MDKEKKIVPFPQPRQDVPSSPWFTLQSYFHDFQPDFTVRLLPVADSRVSHPERAENNAVHSDIFGLQGPALTDCGHGVLSPWTTFLYDHSYSWCHQPTLLQANQKSFRPSTRVNTRGTIKKNGAPIRAKPLLINSIMKTVPAVGFVSIVKDAPFSVRLLPFRSPTPSTSSSITGPVGLLRNEIQGERIEGLLQPPLHACMQYFQE